MKKSTLIVIILLTAIALLAISVSCEKEEYFDYSCTVNTVTVNSWAKCPDTSRVPTLWPHVTHDQVSYIQASIPKHQTITYNNGDITRIEIFLDSCGRVVCK